MKKEFKLDNSFNESLIKEAKSERVSEEFILYLLVIFKENGIKNSGTLISPNHSSLIDFIKIIYKIDISNKNFKFIGPKTYIIINSNKIYFGLLKNIYKEPLFIQKLGISKMEIIKPGLTLFAVLTFFSIIFPPIYTLGFKDRIESTSYSFFFNLPDRSIIAMKILIVEILLFLIVSLMYQLYYREIMGYLQKLKKIYK